MFTSPITQEILDGSMNHQLVIFLQQITTALGSDGISDSEYQQLLSNQKAVGDEIINRMSGE